MHQLPRLSYKYTDLEPHIDAQTMEIHHTKHHQGYIDKLNAALEQYPDLQKKPIESLLQNLDSVPEDIRTAVRNNGGGHANHTLFWSIMSSKGGGEPQKELLEALTLSFDSYDDFKDTFNQTAAARFGSGWAWLVVDGSKLKITSTPNQDSPYTNNTTPILGIDVWEHAYYLKYQNRRPEYISAWWQVVNWPQVHSNYKKALSA